MRALPLVAVVVVVGLLGTGAWFFTRDAGGQAVATEPSQSAQADAPARPDAERLVVPDAIQAENSGRAAVVADAAPLETPSVADSGQEALVASLVGRVVDPAGRPIEGARVTAGHQHDSWGMGRTTREPVETRTDSQGRFELEPAGGQQELRTTADGFVAATMQLNLVPGKRKDIGDWGVDPGVILEGIVLDPQRRPVPGAEIRSKFSIDRPGLTVVTSGGGPLVTTTDDNGRFRVGSQDVGDYHFMVATTDYPNARFEGSTEAPGDQVRDIEVVLEPGAEISGRVMNLPQEGVESLVVRAHTTTPRADGIQMLGLPDGVGSQESREAEVAADGSFHLRGLHVDEDYRLTARVSDATWFAESSRTVPVVVRSGERGVELEYSPGATLVFQAVDAATGEPITEFEAEAGTAWLQPLVDEAGRPRRQHPEGRARFGGLRPESTSDRIELALHAVGYEDYRVEDIAIAMGDVEDLGVLRMQRIPLVRVTVLGTAGRPVVGAQVTLAPAAEEQGDGSTRFRMRRRVVTEDDDGHGGHGIISPDDGSRRGVTDENGVCELSSMPGASCTVGVKAPAYAPFGSETLRLPAVDDYETTVSLTPGGIVEVSVVDIDGVAVAEARVEHRSKQSNSAMDMEDFEAPARTDEYGVARFDFLEPGPHMFRLDESNSQGGMSFTTSGMGEEPSIEGWEVIDVLGGETFTLTLVALPRASLTGRVTEGGEPLAGAYVELHEEGADEPMGGMQMLGGESGVRTNGDGIFEFTDQKSASYRMEVSHPTRAMPMEFGVELFGGANRENVDLPITSATGQIKDQDGKPIAGVEVQAKRYEGEGGGRRQVFMMVSMSSDGGGTTMISSGGAPAVRVTTDEEGRYELRGLPPGVEVFVEGSSPDHRTGGSDPFQVASGEERRDVDLSLLAAGRINVKALRSGQPVGNQLVRANFMGDSENPVSPEIAMLSGDGSAELTGLHVGTWSIKVAPLTNPNGDGAPEQTVEVLAGETKDAVFELP